MSYTHFLKHTLVRFFCMIMLILMQFDVCGYDWIRWFHHSEQAPVEWTLTEKSTLEEAETQLSEWADPVYRHRSIRSHWLTFLPELLTCIFSRLALTVSHPLPSAVSSLQADSPHYLRFGVLRL